MGVIYALKDPRTDLVRYIGQTKVKPENRYAQHIFQWKRCKGKISHVNSWIKHLYTLGTKPIMELLETNIENNNLNQKEIDIIKFYKDCGATLCNHTSGGEGTSGYKQSKDSLEKRLITLQTSKLWKERCHRHSSIMKLKHKEGLSKFGYKHLNKELRIEIGKKHSITMKNLYTSNPKKFVKFRESVKVKVISLTNENVIDKIFNSVTEAGLYYNIECTHITKVCRGKSKSGMTHGIKFEYSK